MLQEYSQIRESLIRDSQELPPQTLDHLSSLAFNDQYGIPLETASQLDSDNQWGRWLAKHEDQVQTVHSTQIKALPNTGGRFVEFDLITNDVDQSSEAHDQEVDDMITPNAITSVTKQLKGSIVNMIDPEKVKDFQEVIKDGAKFGGIGHEHLYTNQDIIPALIIDEVKSIANNTKLRVTAKINEYSQRADDVWSMIQNKTLKGASIEYKVLDQHYKTVEGKVVRVIDDLIISGFALTSKMRNAACGITGWFVKALPDDSLSPPSIEDNKMTDEEPKELPPEEVKEPVAPVEEPKAEEAPAEEATPPVETPESDEVKALKEELASLKAEKDEAKALESDKTMIDELKATLKEEVKAALVAEQKQLVEDEQTKFDQVKAMREEIRAAKETGGVDAMYAKAAQKHNELGN